MKGPGEREEPEEGTTMGEIVQDQEHSGDNSESRGDKETELGTLVEPSREIRRDLCRHPLTLGPMDCTRLPIVPVTPEGEPAYPFVKEALETKVPSLLAPSH